MSHKKTPASPVQEYQNPRETEKTGKPKKNPIVYLIAFLVCSLITAILGPVVLPENNTDSLNGIPAFTSSPYVTVNNNVPYFTDDEITAKSYEKYDPLDPLGRCGVTIACIGRDLMPKDDRGDISQVRPTGWINKPYSFVDGEYLYNRCHLIGFQLTGENANERNLITGTRYMNVQGMLPFENMVADYIKETGNHVMYRVTPVFEGDNLVASGVLMEAWSVEDRGDGICFNVYCYNVQPGVEINYATGENWEAEKEYTGPEYTYILNTSSRKFHTSDCTGGQQTNPANKSVEVCTRQELIDKGFTPAGCCNP